MLQFSFSFATLVDDEKSNATTTSIDSLNNTLSNSVYTSKQPSIMWYVAPAIGKLEIFVNRALQICIEIASKANDVFFLL